jgi:hypothetical protein
MPIVLPGVINRMVTDGLLEVTERECTNGLQGYLWPFACVFDQITLQKRRGWQALGGIPMVPGISGKKNGMVLPRSAVSINVICACGPQPRIVSHAQSAKARSQGRNKLKGKQTYDLDSNCPSDRGR